MPDGVNNSENLPALVKRVSDLESKVAELMSRIETLLKQDSLAPSPVVVETKADTPATESLADDHSRLIAVITAAVMAVLGRRIAVRRITFINQNTVSGWAEAGRQSIHYSHNIRR